MVWYGMVWYGMVWTPLWVSLGTTINHTRTTYVPFPCRVTETFCDSSASCVSYLLLDSSMSMYILITT